MGQVFKHKKQVVSRQAIYSSESFNQTIHGVNLLMHAMHIQTYLEVVGQGMADEDPVLQNRRNFLLALAKAQAALEVLRLHTAHEGPEIRHAFIWGHVLVVAEQRARPGERCRVKAAHTPHGTILEEGNTKYANTKLMASPPYPCEGE